MADVTPKRVRALVERIADGGETLPVLTQGEIARLFPDLARAYLAEHDRAERAERQAQIWLASAREHATQRDHATRHMMKARRERDEARAELDAVCAELDAVREALLTVREDGETCAAAVARLLEESESQLVALRRQGAEAEEARRERDAAVQRADRAIRDRDLVCTQLAAARDSRDRAQRRAERAEAEAARLRKVAWLAEIYLESEGGLGDEEARAQLCDALARLDGGGW